MDAGVPIKAAVAGVAMGLMKEGDDVVVLSDILGDEDALGDMDFKVTGTSEGITALQMDIKMSGLTREIMAKALTQAREGRLHILGEMNKVIAAPSPGLKDHAPKIVVININPDKIRDVIGPGGKMIKHIVAQTGVKIDIDDDGRMHISSPDPAPGGRGHQDHQGDLPPKPRSAPFTRAKSRRSWTSAPSWRLSPTLTAWSISRSWLITG